MEKIDLQEVFMNPLGIQLTDVDYYRSILQCCDYIQGSAGDQDIFVGRNTKTGKLTMIQEKE